MAVVSEASRLTFRVENPGLSPSAQFGPTEPTFPPWTLRNLLGGN